MKIQYSFPMLILAAGLTGTSPAQELLPAPALEERPAVAPWSRAYACMNSLEFSMGGTRNFQNYDRLPDHGLSQIGHGTNGFEISARYTRFFTKHWGTFFHLGSSLMWLSGTSYEDELYNIYNTKEGTEKVPPFCISTDDYTVGTTYGTILLGAVYRYDVERWSFRPSLGLGMRRQHTRSETSHTLTRYGEDEYYTRVRFSTRDRHGNKHRYMRAFALSPSIQINFTPRNHMYFLSEVSWTVPFRRLTHQTTVHAYKHNEDSQPKNWVDALLWPLFPHSEGEYLGVMESYRQRYRMGNFFSLRFGIGWNIGR